VRRNGSKVAAKGDAPDAPAGAEPFVPQTTSLRVLREAAQHCRGCDLYKHATQAVIGEGKNAARIMLVGEQPGDKEDQQGHPFVGPAGALLDRALEEAGLRREEVFLTNAVKHFKWEPRGKRRIHKKPRVSEINACRPWLDAELRTVKPAVVVCLGATAAQSIFGSGFKLMQERGRILPSGSSPRTVATIHPSAVLRAADEAGRRQAYQMLVGDLRVAKDASNEDSKAQGRERSKRR
jgi:uracil-DNA glycosylase family protein